MWSMLERGTGHRDSARNQSGDIKEGRKVEGNRSGLRVAGQACSCIVRQSREGLERWLSG